MIAPICILVARQSALKSQWISGPTLAPTSEEGAEKASLNAFDWQTFMNNLFGCLHDL
jgi:hypothetical protein